MYSYRANTRHQTAVAEVQQLEWACDEQQYIFNYGPEPLCASGGYGAGKTIGFERKLLWLMDKFPGYRCMIARAHFEDLKKTTLPSFFKICPPEAYNAGGRRADSDKTIKLNPVLCADGKVRQSELLWMHFDDPAIADVINGLELNAFLLDQAEDMREGIFERLLGRLGRWDDAFVPPEMLAFVGSLGLQWEWFNEKTGIPVPPTYACLTCNPEDEFHWIYRRFHPDSPDFKEERIMDDGQTTSYERQGYKMVFMDSTKNKFLSKDNLNRMLSNDPVFVRRYVRGKWGNPEGTIHNISKQSEVPGTLEVLKYIFTGCRLHRVLDHGDTAPTCCTWWASDRDGNLICYREYYEPNKLISQHRQAIHDLSQHFEDRPGGLRVTVKEEYEIEHADPQTFAKTMQKYGGKWSVQDEYSDCVNLPEDTALFWQPADNNEMATRNRISEYLKIDPEHVNPFTKERGAPHLYFVMKSPEHPHGCDVTLRETRSQRREKIGEVLGKPVFSDDRDTRVPDHSYDTVRYIVAARPPSAYLQDVPLDPNSFAEVRRRHIDFKRRGGHRVLAAKAEAEFKRRWRHGG